MGQSVRVEVKQDVLRWAINESQKLKEEVADKFPKIDEWIERKSMPTIKQVEKLANFLKVPFGYMLLDTPPQSDVMKVEFRSIENKVPNVSKNLKDTIIEMDKRQAWMSEYRTNLGWEKLDIIKTFTESKMENIDFVAQTAKGLLHLEEEWYDNCVDYTDAYKFLREKIELSGIIVMQNGIVGFDTHRRLDLDEFRAFMLYDQVAPLIFINGTDSVQGKIFSLIHEYIHILYEQEDVFLESDISTTKESEKEINKITAELLMPTEKIYALWNKQKDTIKQIDELSRRFKVSGLALAIKLESMKLIDSGIVRAIKARTKKAKKSSSGGDFYRTYRSKVSDTFARAVINEAESGNVSYTYAFELLGGIRGEKYDKIKGQLYG